MVKICCVKGCSNESYDKCGISFHSFPKKEHLRAKWVEALGEVNSKNPVVCSHHFKREDFKPTILARLNDDAVPSLERMESKILMSNKLLSTPTGTFTPNYKRIDHPLLLVINLDHDYHQSQIVIEESEDDSSIKCEKSYDGTSVKCEKSNDDESDIDVNRPADLCETLIDEPLKPTRPFLNERSLLQELQRVKDVSEIRSRKLRSCRNKCERLKKKVAKLQEIIKELRSRPINM